MYSPTLCEILMQFLCIFLENTSDQTPQTPIQLNDLRNFLSTLGPYPDGDQRQAGNISIFS